MSRRERRRLRDAPGIIETLKDDIRHVGADFFGDERIGAVIQGAAGEPAAEIGDRLLQALEAFVGDAPSHDDVSLMVLRRVNHA